ncbi:uracil-DNA glycosylase, partial [Conchiformibius steedae]
LTSWAQQGVLLLNTVLTVRAHQANSHADYGWETFTDRVIAQLDAHREHLVFMLWGGHAQRKAAFVDTQRHLVLKAPHPSPLSAYRGFFGCRHFSQANAYLQQHGLTPINWQN